MDGETLWDAGYRSVRLYFSLMKGVAEHIDLPMGLARNDRLGGCDVEPAVFRAFVAEMYDSYFRTNSAVLRGLWRGPLVTSLVLLDMAGAPLAPGAGREDALWGDMAAVGRSMGAPDWRRYGDVVPDARGGDGHG
ncbi:DUF6086 family protein [Streptomyces showdoensis]|uniref:Uncharacterized protein n=1 Tax=Streptomyces showdoensis TaxID=68268 RepID=A0A2P2GPG0_STREW|nr:hypothetical protein VO63_16835 [Streptomyces showdoensis]